MTQTVRVVARITARPDTVSELHALLLGLLEPTCIQLKDGRIVMLMRAELARMTAMPGMPDFAVGMLHSLLAT